MGRIRLRRTSKDHFTIIPNALLRDPSVSPNAVKLYGFLNSHSSGWDLSTESIAKALGKARGTIGKAFNELEALGYVHREWIIEDGLRQGVEYHVYDAPEPIRSDCSKSDQSKIPGCSKNGRPQNGRPQIEQHKKNNSLRRTSLKEDQEKHMLDPDESSVCDPGWQALIDDPPSVAKARSSKLSKAEIDEAFEKWWSEYPRKIAKKAARKAYERSLADVGTQTLLKAVQAFREHHRRAKTETRYIPHPATWLNQGRWADEPEAPTPPQTSAKPKTFTELLEVKRAKEVANVIEGEVIDAEIIESEKIRGLPW